MCSDNREIFTKDCQTRVTVYRETLSCAKEKEDEGTRTSLIEISVKNKDLVFAVVALGVKVAQVMVPLDRRFQF